MRLFKEHPESIGETYFEHMATAFSFSGRLFLVSVACLIHGIFPFLFTTTGKRAITDLHHRMVTHRRKSDAAGDSSLEAAE